MTNIQPVYQCNSSCNKTVFKIFGFAPPCRGEKLELGVKRVRTVFKMVMLSGWATKP